MCGSMSRIFSGFLTISKEANQDLKETGFSLLVITVSGSLCLLFSWILRDHVSSTAFTRLVWGDFPGLHFSFYSMVNWFSVYFVLFLLIPILVAALLYKGDLKSVGMGVGNLKRYLPLYLLLLLLFIPFLIIASGNIHFRNTYPLMRVPLVSFLIVWEILYLLQFLAVEFFFRGFLLFPFCKRFGVSGILFSVMPYCLIHLGKPVPEAVGSIFAGLILGYFAWKSYSIWGGLLLHGGVALFMDLFVLIRS